MLKEGGVMDGLGLLFSKLMRTGSFGTIPMRGNVRVLCPCVTRKFVDWDVPAAVLGLLGVA